MVGEILYKDKTHTKKGHQMDLGKHEYIAEILNITSRFTFHSTFLLLTSSL
jgi:hypothetical protein